MMFIPVAINYYVARVGEQHLLVGAFQRVSSEYLIKVI